MVVEVYNGSTFTKKTIFNQVISYRYKQHLYNIGDFELVIADTDPGDLWYVEPGDIMVVFDDKGDNDSLLVQTITYE